MKTGTQERYAEFVFSIAGAIGPVNPVDRFADLGLTLQSDERIIKATMSPTTRELSVTMRVPVGDDIESIADVPMTGLVRQLADLCVVRTTAIGYTGAKIVSYDV